MLKFYNYQSRLNANKKSVNFPFLKNFYKNLPEDYKKSSRRLSWDNQTLGKMALIMAEDTQRNFGKPEDTIARSSKALGALLFEHNMSNFKIAVTLPPTWPREIEENGFISINFTGFAEKFTSNATQISLINQEKEMFEERTCDFYPVDSNFNEKIGSTVRFLANQIFDDLGDDSIMIMAMAINCWNSLSALKEPSVEISGERSEIDGKRIPNFQMIVALQRDRQI